MPELKEITGFCESCFSYFLIGLFMGQSYTKNQFKFIELKLFSKPFIWIFISIIIFYCEDKSIFELEVIIKYLIRVC